MRAIQRGSDVRVGRQEPGDSRWNLVLFGLALAALTLLVIWPLMKVALGGDQYVFLARHLARGNLNVDDLWKGYGDYTLWRGHKYLPFGPLPAVLLVPLLPLINAGMPLVVVGYAFTALNVFLFYCVLERAGIVGERRLWSTLLYFGGTPYLSVTIGGISSYFAQIITTTFLLLAIFEMLGKRRLPLVGLDLGLAAAARLTAAFAAPFFLRLLARGAVDVNAENGTSSARMPAGQWRRMWRRTAEFAGGLSLPLLAIAAYNFARFGSLTETGFGTAVLYTDVLQKARAVGLFSVAHIPKNLFMMLLQGPKPYGGANIPVVHFPYLDASPWGMGLLFTSPALIFAFRAPRRSAFVQACWLATLGVILPIVTYYGIGYVQFGYRYALDFMPFLLLLTARGLPEPMTGGTRTLVLASVLINMWGAVLVGLWL